MNIIDDNLHSDDLMDIARKWYLRLEDEAGDIDVLDEFETWVEAEPTHREAFDHVVDFWTHIDNLPEIIELRTSGNSLMEKIPLTPPENTVVDFPPAKSVPAAPQGWRKWQKYAVAATVLIICTALVGFYNSFLPEGTYKTATGEQATITLDDGTTVYLNTASQFEVDYSDNLRKIHLTSGEARFDVAKDKDRPFIVATKHGTIRAVGTSFNIYDNEEIVEIIVFEGTVAVNHNNDRLSEITPQEIALEKAMMVTGGERIVAFDKVLGKIRLAENDEVARKNAWRNGKMIFKGQKLSDVIEEISRYSNRKIIIADDGLSEMKMGGAFDIHDFDALIHAIEDTFPVKIIRFTPYVTVIVKA